MAWLKLTQRNGSQILINLDHAFQIVWDNGLIHISSTESAKGLSTIAARDNINDLLPRLGPTWLKLTTKKGDDIIVNFNKVYQVVWDASETHLFIDMPKGRYTISVREREDEILSRLGA